jgi:hypothetical protein
LVHRLGDRPGDSAPHVEEQTERLAQVHARVCGAERLDDSPSHLAALESRTARRRHEGDRLRSVDVDADDEVVEVPATSASGEPRLALVARRAYGPTNVFETTKLRRPRR